MTRRIASAAVALVATVLFAAPATAQDDTWTISPGGDFFGQSLGAPVFTVAESGVEVACSSATVVGTTASGPGLTNPLAVLPAPGTTLADCQSIFRPYDIEQVGDWYLHGDTYDGVDVVTGRITGVELAVTGLGCAATIAGHLDVTYTNSTDRLTVLPNPTLEFTFVDGCLGLFQQGEHLSLDVTFEITPDLTITSPAPVAARDDTWTVTPGGAFHAVSLSEPVMTIQETGMELYCVSASVAGTAKSGSGLTNPLAVLPAPGITFTDCQAPLGYTFIWDQSNDWQLVCDSYDGIDVATCRIPGVVIDMTGPGCTAALTGHLDLTYSSGAGRLTVSPGHTLVFTYIDPAADCLGYYEQGQHLGLAADFQVLSDLTITSP